MSSDDNVPTSAGLTSFNLLDESKLFANLSLQQGMHVLDFGCGVGNYAIATAPYLGEKGYIYAVDPWDEGIETLEIRSAMVGLKTIQALMCAAGDILPIEDQAIDLCLLATVAHVLVRDNLLQGAIGEIKRTLKLGGKIAVVEFYKQEGPPGPPIDWRLSPDELTEIMAPLEFELIKTSEVGPYNYLSLFGKES